MSEQEIAAFNERLGELATCGLISAAISLGDSLGLFKALAKVSEKSSATAEQVAGESGCKPRYVKEWLATMATADIIEVDEDEKFWLKKNRVESLTTLNPSLALHNDLPVYMRGFDKLKDVFSNGGPYGLSYSDFEDFYRVMDRLSQAFHEKHLIPDLIPKVDANMNELLKQGIKVLDVGCGHGFHCCLLAEHYPNSLFTGIDLSKDAIQSASVRKTSKGDSFKNLSFREMDAGSMSSDWTDHFDLVFIFDACHDQMRPDLCLGEIKRVLKPGGKFAMLEVVGSSNVLEDKETLGSTALIMYGSSLFHCLPVGNNSADALGLGAMWGRGKACEMLRSAGFDEIEVKAMPEIDINQLYVCTK